MTISATDQRRINPAIRRIHNVLVIQSRQGWTQADVLKAIADANRGIMYEVQS